MNNKLAHDILLIFSGNEHNKAPLLSKIEKQYGKDEYYECLEQLIKIGYIVDLPIGTVADGSKMFNVSTGKTSKSGKEFLQHHN